MTNTIPMTHTLKTIGGEHIPPRRKVLGLTGNPGAGKSTIARWMADQGAIIVDADRVGHELLQEGSPVIDRLVGAFGDSILQEDGSVNRKALGAIVFADESRLNRLNEIMQPHLHARIRERIESFRRSEEEGPLVVDAALLFEWKARSWMDGVIVVVAPQPVRRQRYEEARGPNANFDQREAAQLPQSFKIQEADVVITNDDTLTHAMNQCQMFWTQ